MKQIKNSRNTINMLLSAYRAIYKSAFFKGLAGAIALSAMFSFSAAPASAMDISEENLSSILEQYKPATGDSADLYATAGQDYNGGYNNATFNISGDISLSKYSYEEGKTLSGLVTAGIDVNGEDEASGAGVITNAQMNIAASTTLNGYELDTVDPEETGRTYLLGAGVWDEGTKNNTVSITNAAINVGQGVTIKTMQLAGATYDIEGERSGDNPPTFSGTVAASVNLEDNADGTETKLEDVYIIGALAEEDESTANTDIVDHIDVNGTVYVGNNVSISGSDTDTNIDNEHDAILGALNYLGGSATGRVTVNGAVSGTPITGAYGRDASVYGEVVIGQSGSLIIYNTDDTDMQLSAAAAVGAHSTSVAGNLEIYGQYGDSKQAESGNVVDIRVLDTEYFTNASATLVINQAEEVAKESDIGTVHVLAIGMQEDGEETNITAENSANSQATINVTIDGYSHVGTLNVLHLEDDGVDYAGSINGTITVGENATVDVINGISAESLGSFSGTARVTQTYNISGTVETLNLFCTSTAGDTATEVEEVTTQATFANLALSADEPAAEDQPNIRFILNLTDGEVGSVIGAEDKQSTTDIYTTGNATLSSISNTQVGTLRIDATNAETGENKAAFTYNGKEKLDVGTLQVITGGKDISNAVSSANATITADAVRVGATGLIYTEYKNSDKTALELGNNISTQGEDLLIQNGEGESEGTLLSQQDGVTSQRNVTTQSKSLAEATVGTAALVNQGAEFIADDGLNSAVAAVARASGNNSAFGALQAGYSEYETGSSIDLTAVTGIVGFAKGFKFGDDLLTTPRPTWRGFLSTASL